MKKLYAVLLFSLLSGLTGCAGTPPSRFYTLSTLSQNEEKQVYDRNGEVIIGLGPVSLPGYLSQPEIVERVSNVRIRQNQFDRWAENLDDMILPALEKNLRTLLGNVLIVRHPWPLGSPPSFQISIFFEAFECEVDGNCLVQARWEIRPHGNEHGASYGFSDFREGAQYPDMDGKVSALSKGLAQVCREISSRLAEMQLNKRK